MHGLWHMTETVLSDASAICFYVTCDNTANGEGTNRPTYIIDGREKYLQSPDSHLQLGDAISYVVLRGRVTACTCTCRLPAGWLHMIPHNFLDACFSLSQSQAIAGYWEANNCYC